MDVDGITTAPRKRPLISSKTGSLSLGRRIALGAVAAGVPLLAFALFFVAPAGPAPDAGGDAAAVGGDATGPEDLGQAAPGQGAALPGSGSGLESTGLPTEPVAAAPGNASDVLGPPGDTAP